MQSDQSSMGALCVAKGKKTKALIRLRECTDLFECLLYAHANLYRMLNTGSIDN